MSLETDLWSQILSLADVLSVTSMVETTEIALLTSGDGTSTRDLVFDTSSLQK